MVSKAKTISYGTAKLEYDANKTIGREHVASEACRHNLYGETPSEIAREMRDIQERSHPNLSKCYFDIVITLSESDAAMVQSQEECQQLVEEYMQRLMMQQLGLSREQYRQMQWIAYQHERTDHNGNLRHWHVLANRVLPDGTVVSDSNIGRKAVRVASAIDRNLTLGRIENTWRLIRSGRYRREDADESVQAARAHTSSWPHVATPRLSSVLNARTDHTHSSNREDEVGGSRSHYDDENNEYRNKGYTM